MAPHPTTERRSHAGVLLPLKAHKSAFAGKERSDARGDAAFAAPLTVFSFSCAGLSFSGGLGAGRHTPMQPQGTGACSLSRRVAFADVQPLRLLIHNENARGSPETVLPSIRGSRGWGETAVRDHSRVGSNAFPDAAPPLRQRQKQPCSKAAARRRRGGTATFSFLQTGTIFAMRKP